MKKRVNEESTVRAQYADASKLNARINLHKRHTVAAEEFHPWVFRHLDLRPGMTVLEIGCGNGALWRGGAIPQGVSLTLTDMNQGMLEEAKAALGGIVPEDTAFRQADAMDLPFAGESFDLVIIHHVLHHVPDIDGAIASVHRVVKPGGYMTTTNGDGMLRELYQLLEKVTGGEVNRVDMAFTVENGAAYLQKRFARVERFDYPSHLNVTDAEDLLAYIDSLMTSVPLNDGQRGDVRRAVEDATREKSGFYIGKTTGMFRAWK